MTIRRLVMPTMLATALVVGALAAPALGQVPDDFHTPSPDTEDEVEVAGVVIEREPEQEEAGTEVGTEVLGVAIGADRLANTGTDTLVLGMVGIGLLGLGVLAFRVGRRRDPAPEGTGTAR